MIGTLFVTAVVQPVLAQMPDSAAAAPQKKGILDFIRAGGIVGYTIIALSVFSAALVIDSFRYLKPQRLIPPSVVCSLALLAIWRLLARTGQDGLAAGWHEKTEALLRPFPLASACRLHPRTRAALAAGALGVLAVTVALPLVSMGLQAGSWSAIGAAFIQIRPQIIKTVLLAAAAGAVVALLASVLLRSGRPEGHAGWARPLAVLSLNAAVPATLLAVGLSRLGWLLPASLARTDIPALLAGWVVRFGPVGLLALFILSAGGAAEGENGELRARPSGWKKLWMPALAAGWLCALCAAANLDLPLHLDSRADATVASRVYTLAHESLNSTTCALGTAIVLSVLPAAMILGLLLGRCLAGSAAGSAPGAAAAPEIRRD
jgi:hypothetical protein